MSGDERARKDFRTWRHSFEEREKGPMAVDVDASLERAFLAGRASLEVDTRNRCDELVSESEIELEIPNGGPAYPSPHAVCQSCGGWIQKGMTLRQSYAKAAMEGLLGCSETHGDPESFAHDAFLQADAMLAFEREEKE